MISNDTLEAAVAQNLLTAEQAARHRAFPGPQRGLEATPPCGHEPAAEPLVGLVSKAGLWRELLLQNALFEIAFGVEQQRDLRVAGFFDLDVQHVAHFC